MSTFANGIGGKLVWGNGLLYLEERGWTELIDPRWTLDVYEELQLSGLGLSDEEMREVIDVICHPEPNWNTTEHLSHKEEYLPTDKDRIFTSKSSQPN